MREFFVYGFKSRDHIGTKSTRSYDNEKRRIESYVGDYMSFRRDSGGKAVFFTVDSKKIAENPLYKAWKAASFTKNDINLHFSVFDILADGKPRSLSELLDIIDSEYLSAYKDPVDESTLRKKLNEYTENGLIEKFRNGREYHYKLSKGSGLPDSKKWRDAISYFTEASPLGVIGSFLSDKFRGKRPENPFSYKHRYLLFALDSGVLTDILLAIRARKAIEIELKSGRGNSKKTIIIPFMIYISTQGGRQYAAGYSINKKQTVFARLDNIVKAKAVDIPNKEIDFNIAEDIFRRTQPFLWGVSYGDYKLHHFEMTLRVLPEDIHIIDRLKREKRGGSVTRLSENEWLFSADVYDPREMLTWIRTFTGRIMKLSCSDRRVLRQFHTDFEALCAGYGGCGDDVF